MFSEDVETTEPYEITVMNEREESVVKQHN